MSNAGPAVARRPVSEPDDEREKGLANRLRRQAAETAQLRQRAEAERLLGDRRLRQLSEARFYMEREAWLPGYELAEDPVHYEEVKSTLRSAFSKLGRAYLEQRLDLDELEMRLRRGVRRGDAVESSAAETAAHTDETWRLRFSPQARIGSESSLGLKMRLAGPRHPLLAKTSFFVNQSLDDDRTSVRLKFAHGEHFVQLEHVLGDHELGNATMLWVRTSF